MASTQYNYSTKGTEEIRNTTLCKIFIRCPRVLGRWDLMLSHTMLIHSHSVNWPKDEAKVFTFLEAYLLFKCLGILRVSYQR